MAVLLKDIAREAGVAPATVSSILNRRSDCWASEQTVKRVQETAKRLGYVPNKTARALRMQQFLTLGLVVPDLLNPFFAQATRECSLAARAAGYDLIIEETGGDLAAEDKSLLEIVRRQVDAILCFPIDITAHREFLALREKAGFPPVVLLGFHEKDSSLDAVEIDFEPGLRAAVDHLVGLGHRRVAFLSGLPRGQGNEGGRARIVEETLTRHKLSLPEKYFIRCGFTVEDAHQAFGEFLDRTSADDRPTALIALNDLTAIGAIRAALDRKLQVPRDFSVIGIDDVPLSRFLPVRLTTVAQPLAEIAKKAVELAIRRIREPKAEPVQATFTAEFVLRESTAAPRKKA